MTLLLGCGRTLGPEELQERREEMSCHVDKEIIDITDRHIVMTELLGRRESMVASSTAGPSSLEATLGVPSREVEDEEQEYSELDSNVSLHVGNGIVKTTNK